MHKKTLFGDLVVVTSLVALFGCGEETTFSPSENVHNEKVATIFELGKCDQVFKGDTVYVEDQSADYYCDGKSWKIIDSDDDLDDDEKSSSSVKSSSSSKKRSTNDDDDDDNDIVRERPKSSDGSNLEKSSGNEASVVVVSSESSRPESSESIRPESSSGVKPVSSADIEPASSSSVRPISSADIEPVSSSGIRPVSSSDVEPASSSDVRPVSSSNVRPASSSDVESSSSVEVVSSSATIPSSSSAMPEVTRVDEVAYELDDAEACNIFTVGHVVYVQSEDEGYICTASGYAPVIIQRPYIPSSSSRVEPASSAIESSSSEPQSSSAVEPTSSEKVSVYITDVRDGKRYEVVTIGSQVWMAENLNYVTENGFANDKVGSWCYNNQTENCDDYGRLYTWGAAMNIPDEYNTASYEGTVSGGICPDGFRLPSRDDWQTLADFVASSRYTLTQYGFTFQESGHYQEIADGGIIKGFNYGPNSTPISGMEFWSSTQDTDSKAYHWESFSANTISEKSKLKIHAYSVRCVRNSIPPCTEEKSGEFAKTNDDIMICKLNGEVFGWVLANGAEQLDYHFGRCSAQLMNHYNEREGYVYICKRRYQGSGDDLVVHYEWELAQGSDLYGYALDDLSCRDKVVKSTSFPVRQPLYPHGTGEQFFYCDEGEWRFATALEYDTYGQACVENLVIPGIHNENRYYYCEDATWRNATTLEYDTYGQECIDGRIIKGNVNKTISYYCDGNTWRNATVTEIDTYGQECIDGRIVKGNVNKAISYYCDDGAWREATVLEIDTYGRECTNGRIVKGNVNQSYDYYCDNGSWRRATDIEVDTYEYECFEGNVVPGRKRTTTYYYCSATGWRLATTLEMDTFGEECSEPRAIRGGVYTDKFYTCDGTKWSASTKKVADTYTHTCEHESVITGNVTGEKYKCINGQWYGYECGSSCSITLYPGDEIDWTSSNTLMMVIEEASDWNYFGCQFNGEGTLNIDGRLISGSYFIGFSLMRDYQTPFYAVLEVAEGPIHCYLR